MKLKNLHEAKYTNPPRKGYTEQQIIDKYFDVDDSLAHDLEEEGVSKAIVPKESLEIFVSHVHKPRGVRFETRMKSLIAYCVLFARGDGTWHAWLQDHTTGNITTRMPVDLTKLIITRTQVLYDGT